MSRTWYCWPQAAQTAHSCYYQAASPICPVSAGSRQPRPWLPVPASRWLSAQVTARLSVPASRWLTVSSGWPLGSGWPLVDWCKIRLSIPACRWLTGGSCWPPVQWRYVWYLLAADRSDRDWHWLSVPAIRWLTDARLYYQCQQAAGWLSVPAGRWLSDSMSGTSICRQQTAQTVSARSSWPLVVWRKITSSSRPLVDWRRIISAS